MNAQHCGVSLHGAMIDACMMIHLATIDDLPCNLTYIVIIISTKHSTCIQFSFSVRACMQASNSAAI